MGFSQEIGQNIMELKNIMEDVIAQRVDGAIRDTGACGCAKCRMDIMAIALNSLPPKYVVTERGELLQKISCYELQSRVDIYQALLHAAYIVKERPRHG